MAIKWQFLVQTGQFFSKYLILPYILIFWQKNATKISAVFFSVIWHGIALMSNIWTKCCYCMVPASKISSHVFECKFTCLETATYRRGSPLQFFLMMKLHNSTCTCTYRLHFFFFFFINFQQVFEIKNAFPNSCVVIGMFQYSEGFPAPSLLCHSSSCHGYSQRYRGREIQYAFNFINSEQALKTWNS